VPFVAEVNEAASNEKTDWFKETAADAEPPAPNSEQDKRNSEQDKWSAERFRRQRDQIIEHIAANDIERIVFLTGDMHCCYHATMRIGPAGKKYESVTVHELAGGPVNQLQLANAREFDTLCTKRTLKPGAEGEPGIEYEIQLERFHGDVSAVMHVQVDYLVRDEVTNPARVLLPEVEWNVIRTLTDPGPEGWAVPDEQAAGDSPRFQSGESVMAGRIAFVKPRTPDRLDLWPAVGAGDQH